MGARYFVDSSALVKRYLEEDGTPRVLDLLERAEEIQVSRLAMLEVTSAVVRRSRGGDASPEILEKLFPLVESDFRAMFGVIELGPAIFTRSLEIVRLHSLRAADAIQLACALAASAGGSSDAPFTLLSCDLELNKAAIKEHLAVENPMEAEASSDSGA